MAKTTKTNPPSVLAGFEQSLSELELVVSNMERGEQSLDDSLAAYERGIALYRQCQQALEQAEQRVNIVNNSAHPEQASPFDDADNA